MREDIKRKIGERIRRRDSLFQSMVLALSMTAKIEGEKHERRFSLSFLS